MLIYNDELKDICIKKLDDFLMLSQDDYRGKPNIIVFPENSIPYEYIDKLRNYSLENHVIIVGGLEHKELENRNINDAFIIENGKIYYQEKQTPTEIKNKLGEFVKENINCKKIPDIKIFQTSLGRIAIFICKDFLRLFEIIPLWARRYRVEIIVVPSLTNKVLPFHSKLLNMFNYLDYRDLKIIFGNIGQYGCSELFTMDNISRIELETQENRKDNLGEKIIIRTIKPKVSAKSTYLFDRN